jgi:hypothetical protein
MTTTTPSRITEWYYADNGEVKGPVPEEIIIELVVKGKVSRDVSVWHAGLTDWAPLTETELRSMFMFLPPPLHRENISNFYVWILALAPAIGSFLQVFIAAAFIADPARYPQQFANAVQNLWWITLVLNSVLAIADERKLSKAGHKSPGIGWAIFLIPVYLYKRASLLRQSHAYFWVWVVVFILSLLS